MCNLIWVSPTPLCSTILMHSNSLMKYKIIIQFFTSLGCEHLGEKAVCVWKRIRKLILNEYHLLQTAKEPQKLRSQT